MVIGKVVTHASKLAHLGTAVTTSASLVTLEEAGNPRRRAGLGPIRPASIRRDVARPRRAITGQHRPLRERGDAWRFVALVAVTAFFRIQIPPFTIFRTVVGEYYVRSHPPRTTASTNRSFAVRRVRPLRGSTPSVAGRPERGCEKGTGRPLFDSSHPALDFDIGPVGGRKVGQFPQDLLARLFVGEAGIPPLRAGLP